jgi:hypothetical protein
MDFDNEFDKAKEDLPSSRTEKMGAARVQLLRDVRKGLEDLTGPISSCGSTWISTGNGFEERGITPRSNGSDNTATPYQSEGERLARRFEK